MNTAPLMESTDAPLGPSVVKAMKFLEAFHEDVYAMVKRLDALFADSKCDLAADMGSRVTSGLGASLEVKYWIIQSISRFYYRKESAESNQAVILVSTRFAPIAFDEPVVMVVVGRFDHSITARSIWDNWSEVDSLLSFLSKHAGPQLVERPVSAGLMQSSDHIEAFTVPLTRLISEQSLKELIVDPSVQIASRLIRG